MRFILVCVLILCSSVVDARPRTVVRPHRLVRPEIRALRDAAKHRKKHVSYYHIRGTIHGIRYRGQGEIWWNKGRCYMHFSADKRHKVCSNNFLRACSADARCKGLAKFVGSPDGVCQPLPVDFDLRVEGDLIEELGGRVRFETTYTTTAANAEGKWCDFTRLPGNRLKFLKCNFDATFDVMTLTNDFVEQ